MKLYTEEQVRQAIRMTRNEYPLRYAKDIINDLTPIELPSDEDIYDASDMLTGLPSYSKTFREGAYWMKEQILNQNK